VRCYHCLIPWIPGECDIEGSRHDLVADHVEDRRLPAHTQVTILLVGDELGQLIAFLGDRQYLALCDAVVEMLVDDRLTEVIAGTVTDSSCGEQRVSPR